MAAYGGYPGGYPGASGGGAQGYPQATVVAPVSYQGSPPGYPGASSQPGYPGTSPPPGYPGASSPPGYPQASPPPGYPQYGYVSAPAYGAGSYPGSVPQGRSANVPAPQANANSPGTGGNARLAQCSCCMMQHALQCTSYLVLLDPEGNDRGSNPHMTQDPQSGKWVCEWCSSWVCMKCGQLELETTNPQPELYKKQLQHPGNCSAEPGVTGWYIGTDEIDRALNNANHPGVDQCPTCRDNIFNLAAACGSCGEMHSVIKDGVKVVDYIGAGSHMTLFNGQWYCEFCIVGICNGTCGEILPDPTAPTKNKWTLPGLTCNRHLMGIPVCHQTYGMTVRFIRREVLVQRAKTVLGQHCAPCQDKVANKRIPYHASDPDKGATLRKVKNVGKVVLGFVKGAYAMGN